MYNKRGCTGTLLKVSELSEEEKDILNREIAMDARVEALDFCNEMDERVYDEVQARVFSEWGVMCPHGIIIDMRCQGCGALVFAAHGGHQLSKKILAKVNK